MTTRRQVWILPFACLLLLLTAACAVDPNQEGIVMRDTVGGTTYRAEFLANAEVIYTPVIIEGGAEISPFPLFLSGVFVTREDGQPVTEQDRTPAAALATDYCARSGMVPENAVGGLSSDGVGWNFGPCEPADAATAGGGA